MGVEKQGALAYELVYVFDDDDAGVRRNGEWRMVSVGFFETILKCDCCVNSTVDGKIK